jgi:hypothetical protein
MNAARSLAAHEKNERLGCNKCFTFWSISVIEIAWLCGLAYDQIGVFLENDVSLENDV